MAVLMQRIAAMALATALTEREPARRHRLSGGQSVAAGFALGTVGRMAVKRGTMLGRRAMPDIPPRRRAVDPARAQPVGEREERPSAQADPKLESPPTAAIEDGAKIAGAGLASDGRGLSTDDAMTRSEEELRVRTVRRQRGRIRVRRYVVTEEVHRTIPLRREEIRIEEDTGPDENADAGESDDAAVSVEYDSEPYEIVLHEEVPVIEKRVVPRERVRIVKDTHREEAEVVDEVRAERIDVERIDVPRDHDG
jgi:stress response protein YsnF